MKQSLSLAIATFFGLSALAASASGTCTIQRLGDNCPARVSATVAHRKAQRAPSFDGQTVEYPKVDEDFSLMPQGSLDNPAEVVPPGYNDTYAPIDDSYTRLPGWAGSGAYSVGGAMMITTNTPYTHASLRTPEGDYSGHVTVKLKAKALTAEWDALDENGEATIVRNSECELVVYPFESSSEIAKTDIEEEFYSIMLNADEGWVYITLDFDNYSSNPTGCIGIYTTDRFLIDDVQVTTQSTFLASPVMLPWSDVTNTSFTANWLPVERAWDYFIYLFEVTGTDDEGNPVLKYCYDGLDDELKASKEEDLESFESGEWSDDFEPYLYYGSTFDNSIDLGGKLKDTFFKFSNLDPTKEYYVAIASHCVHQFSDFHNAVYHAMVVTTPDKASATPTGNDSYRAEWSEVQKADLIKVQNFGIYDILDDMPDFPLLSEDFESIEAEGTDYASAEIIKNCDENYLDDYTALPGWKSYSEHYRYSSYAIALGQGMIGIGSGAGAIVTPEICVKNDDKATFSIDVTGPCTVLAVKFAGAGYQLEIKPAQTHYEFELPTNGVDYSSVEFYSPTWAGFMLDAVSVYQNVHAGDKVYVGLDSHALDKGATQYEFTNLPVDDYDGFAFTVTNTHNYYNPLTGQNETATSDRMAPCAADLTHADIQSIDAAKKLGRAEYYDLLGRRVANPGHGIYVKVQDGKAAKVAL